MLTNKSLCVVLEPSMSDLWTMASNKMHPSGIINYSWRCYQVSRIIGKDKTELSGAHHLFFFSKTLNSTTRVAHVLFHCPYGFLANTFIPIVLWVYLTKLWPLICFFHFWNEKQRPKGHLKYGWVPSVWGGGQWRNIVWRPSKKICPKCMLLGISGVIWGDFGTFSSDFSDFRVQKHCVLLND